MGETLFSRKLQTKFRTCLLPACNIHCVCHSLRKDLWLKKVGENTAPVRGIPFAERLSARDIVPFYLCTTAWNRAKSQRLAFRE